MNLDTETRDALVWRSVGVAGAHIWEWGRRVPRKTVEERKEYDQSTARRSAPGSGGGRIGDGRGRHRQASAYARRHDGRAAQGTQAGVAAHQVREAGAENPELVRAKSAKGPEAARTTARQGDVMTRCTTILAWSCRPRRDRASSVAARTPTRARWHGSRRCALTRCARRPAGPSAGHYAGCRTPRTASS